MAKLLTVVALLFIVAFAALSVGSTKAAAYSFSSTSTSHFGDKKINVAAVVFPEHGHYAPMTAILQACVDKGDDVTIFSPRFFIPANHSIYGPRELTEEEVAASKGAKAAGGVVRYVSLGDYSYEVFDDHFFARLVESHPAATLGEVNKNMEPFMEWVVNGLKKHYFKDHPEEAEVGHARRPDVFLVDYGSNYGAFVAERLKIPTVISWPMALTFPYSTANTNVPFMSFAMSAEPSVLERWANALVYLIARAVAPLSMAHPNKVRTEVLGLPPTDVYQLLDRNAVITPSIYGFEINQPLCPNYFPVGMLLPAMNGTVDDSWNDWLARDCDRLVYINMGSVAVLPAKWDDAIVDASIGLANDENEDENGKQRLRTCVVWKRRSLAEKESIPEEKFSSEAAKRRFRIVRHLPFSPRHLLKHPISKVFVTHCGDTSVFESIEAHTPMVGIPLFADQPNVCARIKDSSVGTFVDKYHLTRDSLTTAIQTVFNSERDIISRLMYMRKTAESQGLALKAAEVLHLIAELGFEGSKALNCKHIDEPWYRVYDIDVMVGLSAILWGFILSTFFFFKCCICRCCGCGCARSKKASSKLKVD